MTTIEIIREQTSSVKAAYRAICRDWQAVGSTPGEALDAVERLVAAGSGDGNGTTVIVQHFRPDAFFTHAQRDRLQALMERLHTARAAGQELLEAERQELERLVNAEWEAAVDRAAAILREAQRLKEQSA